MTTPAELLTGASPARSWAMLGASTIAQSSAAVMMHGPAFLLTALHDRHDLSLATAGLVVAAPTVGVMIALLVWGGLTDRHGEKVVLLCGLGGASAAGALAMVTENLVLFALALLLGGAMAASSNVASGRVVVGWFQPSRRGLAMGIRQTAQPIGVGIGALTMAVTAEAHGIHVAMAIPTVGCAVAAVIVAVMIVDPPRPERTVAHTANPYRGNRYLAKIHAISVLLVVPQFAVWTFALVWLIQDRHWSAGAAGALVAVAQIAGAAGRIVAGQLSDLVRSRMRPLRWVAYAAAAVMALLGLSAGEGWWVGVPLMIVATVVTVADNGLAFTAVAERAGPFWTGRALAVQNTAQFLTSSVVPPLGGAAIGALGFGWTFALSAIFPLAAATLVPTQDERIVS